MKKLLLALSLFSLSASAEVKPEYYAYQVGENVMVIISNSLCPFKEHQKEYPLNAIAVNRAGDKLAGCYKVSGDEVQIQWYKGDKTLLPVQYFQQYPAATL